MRRSLLTLALAMPAAAALAQQAAPWTAVDTYFSAESLSNGGAQWREHSLSLRHGFAARTDVALTARTTERFGLRDRQLEAEASMPLAARLTVSADVQTSPSHHVLARDALGAAVQYEVAHAWLLHGGLRTTGYDSVRVNQALLGVEQYVGDASWSATWRPARAFGTTAHSLELRASRYYGERNALGLILAGGQEASNLGTRVVLTHVRSAALTGRHALDRHWELHYALTWSQARGLYIRSGGTAGVSYVF